VTDIAAAVRRFQDQFSAVRAQIGRVIVGQEEIVIGVLTALFAGGHVLLEGLPGLGKTRLVKTVGEVLDLQFARIQCTPDLMPADILGTTILTNGAGGAHGFEFQRGPVFSNILLADEINRATPKTQSALLQAMQESAVTAGNTTYELPQPNFILATQNPIELEGTYPLPEAQLDRFMLKLLVRPVELGALVTILERTTAGTDSSVEKVLTREDVLAARKLVAAVPAAPPLLEYAARLVLATDPASKTAPRSVAQNVRYGSSPRGAQALLLCAKVTALSEGRFNVAYEDIRRAALPALRHRLILNFEGEAAGAGADPLVRDVIDSVEKR
jgi:MoxR-like ATPase